MALNVNHIVFREERANFVSDTVYPVVIFRAFNNLLTRQTVFRTDQAVVAGNNNVIDVISVFFDHIFDPFNRQWQVVVSEADHQNVFANNVVVHPLIARHVYGIFRDKLTHGVNPSGGVRVIELVVTHYRQEFHALFFVWTRNAGPLFPFNR